MIIQPPRIIRRYLVCITWIIRRALAHGRVQIPLRIRVLFTITISIFVPLHLHTFVPLSTCAYLRIHFYLSIFALAFRSLLLSFFRRPLLFFCSMRVLGRRSLGPWPLEAIPPGDCLLTRFGSEPHLRPFCFIFVACWKITNLHIDF